MRRIYAGLAWIIAGAVVVQAAAIAFAFGGMLNLVSEGGVVDKALLESGQAAGGRRARVLDPRDRRRGRHPAARARAARRLVLRARARAPALWAAIVLGLVVLQVTLGFSITDMPVPRAHPRCERARHRGRGVVAALRVRRSRLARRHARAAEEATSDAVAA